MAIIAGQVPTAQELPVDFKRRVVIKFRPDTRLPYSSAAADELARMAGREWSELTAAHPGISLVPYFSLEEATLRNLAQRSSRGKRATPAPNFALYYAIECPSGVEPESVARAVSMVECRDGLRGSRTCSAAGQSLRRPPQRESKL